MVVHKIDFPFYGIILISSLIIGCLYIYKNLKKEGIDNKFIFYYIVMFIPFALVIGLMYTNINSMIHGEGSKLGFSSYGGLIGTVLAAFIFEFIVPSNKKYLKYTVLSLPLIYGISKLGCSIAGCCYGIPYQGIFKIKYIDIFDEYVFPIQIVEVITNILLFVILNKNKNNENIVYYTFISAALIKFGLDFLRYEHLNIVLSSNQIVSIIIIVVTIIMLFIKCNKKENRI